MDYHGEKRSNATHRSTTGPDPRLAVKANQQTSRLAFSGNANIGNRNGLVATKLVEADGTAKRDAALKMLAQIPGNHRIRLGADKGYDAGEFVDQPRGMKVTPHIAQNITPHRGSNIDERTTRHAGYAVS